VTDETTTKLAPVQVMRGEPFPRSIPWHFHARAWSEYAAHHRDQSAERIAERGGFGVSEVVACLTPGLGYHRTQAVTPEHVAKVRAEIEDWTSGVTALRTRLAAYEETDRRLRTRAEDAEGRLRVLTAHHAAMTEAFAQSERLAFADRDGLRTRLAKAEADHAEACAVIDRVEAELPLTPHYGLVERLVYMRDGLRARAAKAEADIEALHKDAERHVAEAVRERLDAARQEGRREALALPGLCRVLTPTEWNDLIEDHEAAITKADDDRR
jgi:hypothetical protein